MGKKPILRPILVVYHLIHSYGDHLQIDIPASTVVYGENLVAEMIKAEENQIQIYEVQSCM